MLADLKIVDSLVKKNIEEENFDKAVTNLTILLKDCAMDVNRICLKMECLCKAYLFDEANKYSAEIMKKQEFYLPKILYWRGRILIYTGADAIGKKHLTQAMSLDPDLSECMLFNKLVKKQLTMKEEAAELFKANKYQEAIVKFEECLNLDSLN